MFCNIGFFKQADSVRKRGGTCEGCDGIGQNGEDVACSLSVVAADADLVNVGGGLGTTIAGFCMLVDICWERAFESWTPQPPGNWDCLGSQAAAGLRCHVIPAWNWYTVPIATKKESDSVLHSGRRVHCHYMLFVSTARAYDSHIECEGINMSMQAWPFEYAMRGLKLAVCLSAPWRTMLKLSVSAMMSIYHLQRRCSGISGMSLHSCVVQGWPHSYP